MLWKFFIDIYLLKDLPGQGGIGLLDQDGGREAQANMEKTDRERLS